MVKLRELNSRMKDFYDIWLLSRQFDFDGKKLAEAMRLTFEHRRTTLPDEIVAFTEEFADAKQSQWKAFIKKLKQDRIPSSFADIVTGVSSFLGPIVAALSAGATVPSRWAAPGPWKSEAHHEKR
jgi:hypothetical protein